MALHPDVIREIETATTPKRGGTDAPASRQNALEAKVARLEAALSGCASGQVPGRANAYQKLHFSLSCAAKRKGQAMVKPGAKQLGYLGGRGLDDVWPGFPSPHLKKTYDCKIFVPIVKKQRLPT